VTTFLLIALVVLGGSIGDVLITRGMKQIGEIATLRLRELASVGRRVLTNASFLLGLMFMAVSYFSFLGALARADLSLVLPATSVSFVVTTLAAKLFLKERISAVRWTGILLVCVGVILLSVGPDFKF
jgi:drug/metabolite transporter (DMT)-like permease